MCTNFGPPHSAGEWFFWNFRTAYHLAHSFLHRNFISGAAIATEMAVIKTFGSWVKTPLADLTENVHRATAPARGIWRQTLNLSKTSERRMHRTVTVAMAVGSSNNGDKSSCCSFFIIYFYYVWVPTVTVWEETLFDIKAVQNVNTVCISQRIHSFVKF